MFKLIKIENGRQNVPSPEFLTVTTSEAVTEGEALVLSSGKLTKCSGTTKPTHIAMKALAAAATDRVIPAFHIQPNMLFETEIYKSSTTLSIPSVGAKVTIKSDGLSVTDTTTSGVVTLVDTADASAEGDKVVVRVE